MIIAWQVALFTLAFPLMVKMEVERLASTVAPGTYIRTCKLKFQRMPKEFYLRNSSEEWTEKIFVERILLYHPSEELLQSILCCLEFTD